MGAKAIELGSWDKHPTYCKYWNVNVWHMRNGINVMEYFKPGIELVVGVSTWGTRKGITSFISFSLFLKNCEHSFTLLQLPPQSPTTCYVWPRQSSVGRAMDDQIRRSYHHDHARVCLNRRLRNSPY